MYELSGYTDEEDEAQREGMVRKETKEQKSGHASLEARLRLNDVCVDKRMRGRRVVIGGVTMQGGAEWSRMEEDGGGWSKRRGWCGWFGGRKEYIILV